MRSYKGRVARYPAPLPDIRSSRVGLYACISALAMPSLMCSDDVDVDTALALQTCVRFLIARGMVLTTCADNVDHSTDSVHRRADNGHRVG
eukprot:3715538-Rhodomonas_salina.2